MLIQRWELYGLETALRGIKLNNLLSYRTRCVKKKVGVPLMVLFLCLLNAIFYFWMGYRRMSCRVCDLVEGEQRRVRTALTSDETMHATKL